MCPLVPSLGARRTRSMLSAMARPGRRFELHDQRCRPPFLRARFWRFDPGYVVAAHHHGFVQILYVRTGSVRVELDHARVLRPGGIAIAVAGGRHTLRMDSERGCELFDCCLDPESEIGEWLQEAGSAAIEEATPLAPLVEAIRAEGTITELLGDAALAGLLTQFVAACARSLREHHRRGDTGPDAAATVAALEQVIAARYPETLSLDDLAAAVHYSPKHLCRLVSQERGTTPMAMLRALRLRRAQERLLASDEPVVAIALGCGFGDPRHFARRFKVEVGVTPSAYRAEQGAP